MQRQLSQSLSPCLRRCSRRMPGWAFHRAAAAMTWRFSASTMCTRSDTRSATFSGVTARSRVVFACNATDALNTIILGLIEPGCHVLISATEHNSVLRPLYHLRERGLITFDLVPFDGRGFIDPQDVAKLIKSSTKFIILNHVSNVLGTIQPVREVGRMCAEREIPLILDVSQSAGIVPINMRDMHVQAVAFTGHKSLMGPTGIGGLVLREGIEIRATRFGGTGSDSWRATHPEAYPDRLEAGTLNVMGIMGLSAGLQCIAERGMANIYSHEMLLAQTLRRPLRDKEDKDVLRRYAGPSYCGAHLQRRESRSGRFRGHLGRRFQYSNQEWPPLCAAGA